MNALGSPLNGGRHGYQRYSNASSSISSFSAHSSSDDDDVSQRTSFDRQSECSEVRQDTSEYGSKSAPGYGLSFVRKPSSTNHRRGVPSLSQRHSSGQYSLNPSSSDEVYSRMPMSSPRHRRDHMDGHSSYGETQSHKPGSSKHRSSLSGFVSLLSLNHQSPPATKKSSLSASGSSRNSPSTPKLPTRSANGSSSGDALTSSIIFTGENTEMTPRGSSRRPCNLSRDACPSAGDPSGYRSPSPGHGLGPSLLRQTAPAEATAQSAPGAVVRGRSRMRQVTPLASSPEDEDERRGRYTSEEIPPNSAPGYGEGRSGIKHREKDKHRRSAYA